MSMLHLQKRIKVEWGWVGFLGLGFRHGRRKADWLDYLGLYRAISKSISWLSVLRKNSTRSACDSGTGRFCKTDFTETPSALQIFWRKSVLSISSTNCIAVLILNMLSALLRHFGSWVMNELIRWIQGFTSRANLRRSISSCICFSTLSFSSTSSSSLRW